MVRLDDGLGQYRGRLQRNGVVFMNTWMRKGNAVRAAVVVLGSCLLPCVGCQVHPGHGAPQGPTVVTGGQLVPTTSPARWSQMNRAPVSPARVDDPMSGAVATEPMLAPRPSSVDHPIYRP